MKYQTITLVICAVAALVVAILAANTAIRIAALIILAAAAVAGVLRYRATR